MDGCGKDTIMAIIIIIAVIVRFLTLKLMIIQGGLAYLVIHYWPFITGLIQPFLEWFQENLYQGIFLYTAIYTFMVIVFIPTTFLTYGGALAFTKAVGPTYAFFITTVLVVFSNQLGGIVSFVLARFFMRRWIRRKLTRRVKLFRAIDMGLKHNGFKLVFLMRMTPIMPYNVMNYMMGVTSLKMSDFNNGCLGMIPLTAINVYIGVQLDSINEIISGTYNLGPWQPVLITLGAVMITLITSLLVSFSNDELNKILQNEEFKNLPPQDYSQSQISPDDLGREKDEDEDEDEEEEEDDEDDHHDIYGQLPLSRYSSGRVMIRGSSVREPQRPNRGGRRGEDSGELHFEHV